MKKSDALRCLRGCLLDLADTGPSGFEGFLAPLLESATGWTFHVIGSGEQGGADLIAEGPAGPLLCEAKHYSSERDLKRAIMPKLGQAPFDARGRPDLWILAATVPVGLDIQQNIAAWGEELAIGVAILDWSGTLPPLAVLAASTPDAAVAFLVAHAGAREDVLGQAIAAIRGTPRFEAQAAELREMLRTEASALRILLADSAMLHDDAMASRARARTRYRQALTPLEQAADRRPPVERRARLAELDELFARTRPWRGIEGNIERVFPPIAVIGQEGVGKSWLVVDWWRRRFHDQKILLFISSADMRRGAARVAELLSTSCVELLAHRRIPTPEARARWQRRLNNPRFWRKARGRVLVVLDGLNEAPDLDWPSILGDAWAWVVERDGLLVVTSRPSIWHYEIKPLPIDWPDVEWVPLGGFSDEEVRRAAASWGRDFDALPVRLGRQIRNPRAFALAMTLLDTLPPDVDLGVDRLLFEYWEHRRRERSDLAPFPETDFWRGLTARARTFQVAREASAHARGRDLDASEHVFEQRDFIDDVVGLRRYPIADERANALLGEIEDGRFLKESRSRQDRKLMFRRESLGLALGLFLVADLAEFARTIGGAAAHKHGFLREHLLARLEPVMDFDQTADQLLAAVTVACCDRAVDSDIAGALIDTFVQLHNRPDELRPEFQGLVILAADVFMHSVERAAARYEPEAVDDWLVDATRIGYRVLPARNDVIAGLTRWLANEAVAAGATSGLTREHGEPIATRLLCLATRVLTGQDCQAMLPAFLGWARGEAARRGANPATSTARRSPRPSPVAQFLRIDASAASKLECTVLACAAAASANESIEELRAIAVLCAALATPAAVRWAESTCPGAADLFEPPPAVVSGMDETNSTTVPASAVSDDNAASAWQHELVALAQHDIGAFARRLRVLALSALPATSNDSVSTLSALSIAVPSFWSLLAEPERALPRPVALADWAGSDPLVLEAALESVLAATDPARRAEILAGTRWDTMPVEGWSPRARRWRPYLPSESVCELVALATRWSETDPESMASAGLLSAIALHPLDSLDRPTQRGLLALTLDRQIRWEIRKGALEVCYAARDAGVARGLMACGWSAADEPDRLVANVGSALLAATLGGCMAFEAIAERIFARDLPRLADKVADAELPALIGRIESAVYRAIAITDARGEAMPDGGPDTAVEREAERQRHQMAPLEPLGARRIHAAAPARAETWLDAMSNEIARSTRVSLLNAFGQSLASEADAPSQACVRYIGSLLGQRIRARRGGAAARAILASLVTAVLRVAARNGAAADGLLDALVLSSISDWSFMRIAQRALDDDDAVLARLVAWINANLACCATPRLAAALTLSGYLATSVPSLRAALNRPPVATGYLQRVAAAASKVAEEMARAEEWIEERGVARDSERICVCECLALATNAFVSPRRAGTAPATSDDLSQLFRTRLDEMTERAMDRGRLAFLGGPPPPAFLFVPYTMGLARDHGSNTGAPTCGRLEQPAPYKVPPIGPAAQVNGLVTPRP